MIPILQREGLLKPERRQVEPWSIADRALALWPRCTLAMPFWGIWEKVCEDVSGNNLHGAFGPALLPASGAWIGTPYGGAVHFVTSAGNSKITITDPASDLLDGTTQLSLEILFRPAGVTGTQGLLSKYRTNTNQRSWRLYLNGAELELQISVDGVANEIKATTAASLSAGVWYHVVVTYNSGVFAVYLNGKSVAVSGNFTATSLFAAAEDLLIGQRTDGAGLVGDVTSVRAWVGRVLAQPDAAYLCESPWAMYDEGLYFPSLAVADTSSAGAGAWSVAGTVAKGVQALKATGLTNGVAYDLRARPKDLSGNLAAGNTPVSATPAATAKRWPGFRWPLAVQRSVPDSRRRKSR
jgi:hypothetical protein